jgi:hypothetical protein
MAPSSWTSGPASVAVMPDDQPTGRDLLNQAVLHALLLTAALTGVNRFARGLGWEEAVLNSVTFAVPFIVVWTALGFLLQRVRHR